MGIDPTVLVGAFSVITNLRIELFQALITACNRSDQTGHFSSDYVAGCTLLELQKSSVLRELVNMTEEDRIQAAVDITEAVYYIHSLSSPIVHQNISAKERHLNAKSIYFTSSCPLSSVSYTQS